VWKVLVRIVARGMTPSYAPRRRFPRHTTLYLRNVHHLGQPSLFHALLLFHCQRVSAPVQRVFLRERIDGKRPKSIPALVGRTRRRSRNIDYARYRASSAIG
jgi:hypothetical protein